MAYYLLCFLFLKSISINYLSFFNTKVDDCVNKIFVTNTVPSYNNQNYENNDNIYQITTQCRIDDYKNKYLKKFAPYEFNTYLNFEFRDTDPIDGFMCFIIYFNEYIISTEKNHDYFWECYDCF